MSLQAFRAAITDAESRVVIASGSLRVTNSGAQAVYLGAPGVTAADGYALAAGATLELEQADGPLHAICASGESSTLQVITG